LKKVYVSFFESSDIIAAIDTFCEAAGRTRSSFIREALRRALAQGSWPLNEKPEQEKT
jgi:metal-responsive CopG/Arc/MetJ family transcriptional regulator